ncbi:MAG TPA: histidine phosphatase family protein [Accumulibacter sp.]|uniref:histidine phosphatase family protein n=1 Tax=Accumulibacter sp. TaxID=2053492 RepID=UPI002879F6FC|nr:histidine phosphatase family protein [Accumulibacter sp.]MDS4055538.1 histidine phosphatase family protein [Accumulibacter sp.]HMV03969.1 histidine phosphatase family protein [Accumulibacter sp.]HMW62319.1 histidine phosphatase family protein [Accumulibacter sp.]HMW78801.1 histidine phosphatase family protein [Accumulibacter sp.]HMX68194.1 histidine phosphatase family protein [Accumulibacter sp.]
MKATRICLVRHGETTWNAEKRIQGQIDIGLNSAGLVQAEAAARWLSGQPVAALYSSDLLRARQTAERIAVRLRLQPHFLAEFRERRYGFFEGLTYDESRARYPAEYRLFETRDPAFVIPFGGESLQQLHERVGTALARLAVEHGGQTIVVVTHGGVLDIVNRLARGNALSNPRDFLIPNAGINWVTGDGEAWRLEAWGVTAHLNQFGLDELP